ncbi:DUF397 domain-containing protein [Streptomyces sp. SID14478]|uniref:DUF397 domain-containing protein n=1 Tax=Streptomyces sp. SID14478 TaxID=2706073 RepID=UPI0013DD1AD7|nr:DUF397 domain-containing protein [Streptomyces sp. SID14478]NEB76754.1 DUF397 domain-containing protein [Streptomyces sp. SID14478]
MIRKTFAEQAGGLRWFKSSHSSSGDTSDCIEVALDWRVSTYSSSSNGEDCVEVAPTPTTIHIRDSKNPDGPRLTADPAAWAAFVTHAATTR